MNSIALALSILLALATQSLRAEETLAHKDSTRILEERLKNAQGERKTFSNGATFDNYKFAGSLQPNVDLGCISMQEVTNKSNAPALIYASLKCIKEREYAKALALNLTGLGFAYYDTKRLADRATGGARSVLLMNAYADMTEAERRTMDEVTKRSGPTLNRFANIAPS